MLLACIADLLLSPAVLAVNRWIEQLPTPAAWLTANETCASALQSCTEVCNMATMSIKQNTSVTVGQCLLKVNASCRHGLGAVSPLCSDAQR